MNVKKNLNKSELEQALRLKELNAQIKLLEVEAERIKTVLKEVLPKNQQFIADGVSVKILEVEKTAHSWDVVKDTAPDVYEKSAYTTTQVSIRIS